MEHQQVTEVLQVFENYKEGFTYAEDGFAVERIRSVIGDGAPVMALRQSSIAPLLSRPAVKVALARCGDGHMTEDRFEDFWQIEPETFLVTLDKWGATKRDWRRSYHQMARPGFNLVIQLNLTGKQVEQMLRAERTLKGVLSRRSTCHPVRKDEKLTLAWARVDLDLSDGVALIEEIQSDWIRLAQRQRHRSAHICQEKDRASDWVWQEIRAMHKERLAFLDGKTLRRLEKIWPEAMLEATRHFLMEEIGIEEILMYNHLTGLHFKGLQNDRSCQPPQSLYTKTPKRFGMSNIKTMPSFISGKNPKGLNKAIRNKPWHFWRLAKSDYDPL